MGLSDKDFGRLYTGNALWYHYFAEQGQQTYLQRNIKAVLRSHDRELARPISSSTSKGISKNDNTTPRSRPERGQVIHGIASRLAPYDLGVNQAERILRLDVNCLKRKRTSAGAARKEHDDQVNDSRKASSSRCRCEITFWQAPQIRRGSSTAHETQLLCRDSQFCTVFAFDAGTDSALIELDRAFLVSVTKLLVPRTQGAVTKLAFAPSYTVQFSLQPLIYDEGTWPPLPVNLDRLPKQSLRSASRARRASPLVAKLNGPLRSLSQRTLWPVKSPRGHEPPGMEQEYLGMLQVDMKWSKPQQSEPVVTISLPHRRAKPASNAALAHTLPAKVQYLFRPFDWEAEGDSARTRTVIGYLCSFCRDFKFSSAQLLEFHLVNNHDLFRFRFSRRVRPPTLKIQVDVNNQVSALEDDDVDDEDDWTWLKPRRRLVIADYIEGDDSWILGKRAPSFSRSKESSQPQLTALEAFNNETSAHPKGRLSVPPHPSGGSFFRNSTKRALEEGERFSDSDSNPDETWLRQKHAETIDDFCDVSGPEKEFIKRFDDFMFDEYPLAHRYLPEALYKFTLTNRKWLRRRDMAVEFLKHGSKLVLYGLLDPRVLRNCAVIVEKVAGANEAAVQDERADLSRETPKTEVHKAGAVGQSSGDCRSQHSTLRSGKGDPPLADSPSHDEPWRKNQALCVCGQAWSVGSEAMCEASV